MRKITNQMQAARTIAIIVAFTAALIMSLTVLTAQTVHAASNFIIEDFDVEMTVNEDDTYDIHDLPPLS